MYSNFQEMYLGALKETLYHGRDVTVKSKKTKEIHPAFYGFKDATRRTLFLPHRGNNPFATLAETMWVLAGRRDMAWLKPFLPRCELYSDNGISWRAGYGPRIRSADGYTDYGSDGVGGIDQIRHVYETLRTDPESRQAVITIWDPAKECTIRESRDIPCTISVNFLIREGRLDCTVYMRSSDIWFGVGGINVYEWTVLQEILARLLGVKVGAYYHVANSLHIYEEHWKKVNSVLMAGYYEPDIPVFEFDTGGRDYDLLFEEIGILCRFVEEGEYLGCVGGTFMKSVFRLLEIYQTYLLLKEKKITKKEMRQVYLEHMSILLFTDLKAACHWWMRKNWFKIDPGEDEMYRSIDFCRNERYFE